MDNGFSPDMRLGLGMAAAYLLGAVPFGLIVVWLKTRRDVRGAGSGNIGATNVTRVAGRALGVVTLLLDAAKGALPVLLAAQWGASLLEQALLGAAAFLGHCFPVYLRFAGGKGIATGLGVVLAMRPAAALLAGAVFAVVFAVTRISAAGTLCGVLSVVVAAVVLGADARLLGLLGAMVAVVVLKHRPNIQRMLQGAENRF